MLLKSNRILFLLVLQLLGSAGTLAYCDDLSRVAEPPTENQQASRALAEYLSKEDLSYSWKKFRAAELNQVQYAELILTSQTWREITWKHRLFIIKPKNLSQAKQAILVIAGGSWNARYESDDFEEQLGGEAALFARIAEQFQSPVAVLLQVPHQPLFDGLVEDEIIALTFKNYLDTGDPEWPLLLPMVKSAVRGMDAVQEFCESEWSLNIESFTVTGASKRGWTTWLAGAADPRVTAIAPMVIDTLGMNAQMEHQVKAWGDYSNQIEDYTENDLQQRTKTPAGQNLVRIVDPLSYREQLKQPKLIIIGTNDRYWPLDALNLYWDQLLGPKHILYVPNNGHGIVDFPRVLGGLLALHAQAAGGKEMPELTWSFKRADQAVTLRIDSDQTPAKVQMWIANSETRDFRDAQWTAVEAEQNGETYFHKLQLPTAGYTAMLGEAVYDRPHLSCYLSTNVQIVAAEE